jgi:hypothetical protein
MPRARPQKPSPHQDGTMDDNHVLAYSGLVPMLPVTDVPRTISVYEQMGFTVGHTHTPDGVAL